MRDWIRLIEEAWVPSSLEDYAGGYMNGMGATDVPDAIHPASEYDWRYEARYPIATIEPAVDKVAWMKDEIQMWAEEGQPERYDDMIHGQPIEDPIILVETSSQNVIVDGWHRVGAVALSGGSSVPAVVGRLKQ